MVFFCVVTFSNFQLCGGKIPNIYWTRRWNTRPILCMWDQALIPTFGIRPSTQNATLSKPNWKIVEIVKIDRTCPLIPLAWYRHYSEKWQSKTFFMGHPPPPLSEMMQAYKCFPHMRKMQVFRYHWTSSFFF